jgi:hypothetical protein
MTQRHHTPQTTKAVARVADLTPTELQSKIAWGTFSGLLLYSLLGALIYVATLFI